MLFFFSREVFFYIVVFVKKKGIFKYTFKKTWKFRGFKSPLKKKTWKFPLNSLVFGLTN